MRIPLLLYSDAPEGVTGLGRITRDLAQHIYNDPDTNSVYEVATYGYQSIGSRQLPWPQYSAKSVETVHPDLRTVWEDFSQGREGALLPIMPPSWIFGLVHPNYVFQENPKLAEMCMWLGTKPFQIWPYLAIESCGPGMKFNAATVSTIVQCAKPLFYSRFGQKVAENSGIANVPFIHHGIYTDIFKRSGVDVIKHKRQELKCNNDTVVIGCCATNTSRKRLGLLFASFAHYQSTYQRNSKLWLHTNREIGEWNIGELLRDYGFTLNDSVAITLSKPYLTDQWLADFYSTCNATILPTHGEGFGYPIVESQACGTPCVTGSFACEAELTTPDLTVGYLTSEPEGIHNLIRPHYNHQSFSNALNQAIHKPTDGLAELIKQRWDWEVQWPKFKEWLLK